MQYYKTIVLTYLLDLFIIWFVSEMAANKVNNTKLIPETNYKPPELPEELKLLTDRVSATLVGKTIFITGGSGFLGKVLIEKILRKTPEIRKIYMLLRPKKGKEPRQRIEEIFSSPVSF